jgi:tRNA (guanine37-N1)-methyltransferase
MKIDIISLFPKMFNGPFSQSIIKRSQDEKIAEIKIHDLRIWTKDKRRTADDRPFGGGPGMIIMVEPIDKAINYLKTKTTKTILLSPRGKVFNQTLAKKLSKVEHLILICGHYEGVDERVKKIIDEEISIGDFILTGGELPAAVLTDCLVRLLPKVLKKEGVTDNESFSENLLEYPQYTRPANYKNWKVPKILLNGNHKEINKWRKTEALKITKKVRPDLLK